MKNPGLMAILFFLVGILLIWAGLKNQNPIFVIRSVLTGGSYGKWTELGSTSGGTKPPDRPNPPGEPGTGMYGPGGSRPL